MPKFVGLAACDTWAALGGTPQREVARTALVTCRAQFTIENPDQNRLDFGVRRNWDGLSELKPRTVMRSSYDDGSFDEWRLNTNHGANIGGTAVKQFSALPPIYMLAECGEYYTTPSSGIRDYSYSLLEVTPATALTTLVLGTPGIPGFVSVGTIDGPIASLLISVESTDEGKTPLAIVFQIRDAVRAKGVSCEVQFRRIGSSGYAIDFLTQIGASATVPEFSVGKNLLDYLLTYNCTQQATRIRPKGPTDSTGLASRLSRARFKVTGVNGGTKRITVADDAGGAGPIQFDEQCVGWSIFRERTGRSFQILHTYKATQEIELADVSTMAAHTVTAPEWITFRESENNAGTRRMGSALAFDTMLLDVSGVAGNVLTVRDYSNGIDYLNADDRWVDWRTERATFVLAPGFSSTVTDRLDCTSVTGVQAGDVVLISTSASYPYSVFSPVGTVLSIDTVNKYLYVQRRYAAGNVVSGTLSGFQLRIYRPVGTTHLITDSAAAANTITVDAAGTAAIGDLLLRVYQPCQGIFPTFLESAADRVAYGVKHETLGVDSTGECNLIPNAVMRSYTGGAAVAADAWTWTESGAGASATIARNSDPAYTRQGGFSSLCNFSVAGGKNGTLLSPLGFVHVAPGQTVVSARARLWFTVFNVNATCTVALVKVSTGGTITTIGTPVTMLAASTNKNVWVDATITTDISTLIDERLAVQITANSGYGVQAYVDGVQVTQTPSAPGVYPELLVEYAEGTKGWQRANAELLQYAPPPEEYTAKVADLARLDPTRYGADALTLGGGLRLVHAEQAVDKTVRCLSLSMNYLDDTDTDCTIGLLPTRFTTLVSAAA